MRQDDLLAYIDREEDEKYHKVNHLISFTHIFVFFFGIGSSNMVFVEIKKYRKRRCAGEERKGSSYSAL